MREKLIELLMDMPFGNSTYEEEERHMEDLADYLIANGVTVQQWIPVTERKPDLELVEVKAEDMDLFPCLISKNTVYAKRIVTKAWYDGIGFMDSDCIDITNEVTHWMPLPSVEGLK